MQNARYFTGRFICFYQGSITGRTVTGMGITMNQNVIVAKDISKSYQNGPDKISVIQNLSLEIAEKEIIAVVGPSGSGKSTLLNILSGIDTVDSGSIFMEGEEITAMKKTQLADLRLSRMGFVFQTFNLLHSLNVFGNIILSSVVKHKSYDREYVEELIQVLNIGHRTHFYPEQLSIGEQQRVAIARALAKNPKLLLCDEPTGALDYNTGKAVLKLLQDACRKQGMTVVVITHNQALTAMADRVITVKSGTVWSMELNEHIVPVEEIEW